MDIYVNSSSSICTMYVPTPGAKKEDASVIISPIKIMTDDNGMNIRVIQGCNLWQGCENKKCHFSAAARRGPKIASPHK